MSEPARARPVVRLQSVTKHYAVESLAHAGLKNLLLRPRETLRTVRDHGRFTALEGVTFDVSPGECLGIVGANGSGKSTTLGLIAGVLEPSAGHVETRGRVCPLLELGAGFHHELTGLDNIVLNGVLLGLSRREIESRLADIAAFSELGAFLERPIRTYSTGMLERLGFAVAVHLEPDVLLVDEVLAVGDQRFQGKCLARMEAFLERGVALVFVSHDMDLVARLCTRVALLDRGKLAYLGDPAEGIARYRSACGQSP